MLVERIGEPTDRVGEILVSIAGGPHAKFATEVARAIATTNDSRVEIVNMFKPGATEADRDEAREMIATAAAIFENDERVEQSIVEGDDIVDTSGNDR